MGDEFIKNWSLLPPGSKFDFYRNGPEGTFPSLENMMVVHASDTCIKARFDTWAPITFFRNERKLSGHEPSLALRHSPKKSGAHLYDNPQELADTPVESSPQQATIANRPETPSFAFLNQKSPRTWEPAEVPHRPLTSMPATRCQFPESLIP
jgi:hypothetical protein